MHGDCPRCGSSALRPKAASLLVGIVGMLLMKPVECGSCGHAWDTKKPDEDLATRTRRLALGLNLFGGGCILLVLLFVGVWIAMWIP
jgi:hypothetical protein